TGVDRLGEAGPAATRVVLHAGVEQLVAASGAAVGAGGLGVPVGAGEGPLGPLLAHDMVLLGGELRLPLGLGLLDLVLIAFGHGGVAPLPGRSRGYPRVQGSRAALAAASLATNAACSGVARPRSSAARMPARSPARSATGSSHRPGKTPER